MKKKILEVLLGSLKAKIITGVVATLIVGGIVTGGVIYNNKINNITYTDNDTKLQYDIPDDTALTEEEAKEREEALALKELEVAKSEGEKKAEEETAKNSEDINKKPVSSEQNTNQGSETPTSVNVGKSGNSNSDSSGGQTTQPSTPAQQPQQPTPPPPAPVKKDSYWNDNLAQQAVTKLSNESTNQYSGGNQAYTQQAYSTYFSIAESFKNGSISAGIAQSQISGVKFDMNVGILFHLTNVAVGKIEVAGNADGKTIANAVANKGGGASFVYVKVYYNGEIDKNVIYYICAGSPTPVQ
ncbi:hypothetical protein [Clostridium intestinale]|uniref:Uncharacterized protein n=1 Tax=Clostridium intestinale TaxID=36845 RepID=A0A7D7AG70_9CLOT|nr:hypothetical protein [Clostridium intestinale]QLY81504.1 hypothetical protein HZF06_07940 [Clostridium intestinale]